MTIDVLTSRPTAGTVLPLRRRQVVSRWILRWTATLYALAALLQPVSIGSYLSGRIVWLTVHGGVAVVVALFGALVGLASVAYVVCGGRRWVLVGIAAFFVVAAQIILGYTRILAVHVPLGVAIVTTAVLFAVWTWTAGSARMRSRS
jgi:hypothetical protein